MDRLVLIENGVAFTTSKVIAEGAEVEHHAVKQMIEKYRERLETKGKVERVAFEMQTSGGNQDGQLYNLNERQATFLLTLMKNTEPVVEFKDRLTEAFYELKSEQKPLTYIESVRQLLVTLEQNERLKLVNQELSNENETLETALNISLKYFTVAKFNKKYKKNWNMKQCQQIGKELTAFCRANAIEIKRAETNDERFGFTNSYPLSAWQKFLGNAYASC